MSQGLIMWKVETRANAGRSTTNAAAVPLKWAHDARTREPRYIHDPEVIQGSTECTCPACERSLIPVMAGQPLNRRPTAHFRHPKGAQKDDCSVIAARLAATRYLQELGFIELPRRRMSATATGFSGQGYEGWAESPLERISIVGAALYDHAAALLTLADGRELLVDLTGQRVDGSDGHGRAIVTLSLSDPAIAMLGPDEIRARLRILPDIHWCAHWNDQTLSAAANAKAGQVAQEAVDAWSDAEEAEFRLSLPSDTESLILQKWRRETLLHREVKAILEQAARIKTPGLQVEVIRYAPDEFSGEWEENTLRKQWVTASKFLPLEKVQLERRLSSIVPDVIGTLCDPCPYIYGGTDTWLDDDFEDCAEAAFSSQQWPSTLLIEVTVTHGIDQEKLRRIQELNLPALEIDIGSLGGRVTLEGLRNLVVNETVGKRWIHHPIWLRQRKILEAEMDQHPVTVRYQERLAELRRPRLLATPPSEWALIYLAAATEFYDANTLIKKARRAHHGATPKPAFLGRDSEQWQQLMEAAEALTVHGFPGAADLALVDEAGVVPRLLSIQKNRGIGYAVDTGFQVLNAIMQSGVETQRWSTLYPMAVKAYGLEAQFKQAQKSRYALWRQAIIDKVEAGDEDYLRPARYDAVLGVLFPELAPRLAKGYGRSTQVA